MGTIIVTGSAGFIGSNFVRHALSQTDDSVVVLDKLTYAGSLENLADVAADPRFTFVEGAAPLVIPCACDCPCVCACACACACA